MSRTVAIIVIRVVETIFRAKKQGRDDEQSCQDGDDEFDIHENFPLGYNFVNSGSYFRRLLTQWGTYIILF